MAASANGSSCIILDHNEDNEILRKTREAQQQRCNSGSSSAGKKRGRSEPSTNANLVQGEPVPKQRIVQGMGQGKAASVASRSSSSSSSALHQILESPAIKSILATATAPAAAVPVAGADVVSRRIQNRKDIHELYTRGIIDDEQAAKMKSDAMSGV
jgi:hypothetical protein